MTPATVIDALKAPQYSGVLREARGLIELARLLLRFRDLRRQPRGNGEPVLILPGYGAGDGSTVIFKGYLRYLGYNAHGWGLGRNSGVVEELLPRMLKRLALLSRRSKQQVRLIGWSFGGYLAREIARERPDLVRPGDHFRHTGYRRPQVHRRRPKISQARHRSSTPSPPRSRGASKFRC